MILTDALKAIGQIGDPAFRRVLLRGIGLTLALLVGAYLLLLWGLNVLVPDSLSLPFVGEITWLDNLASGFSLILFLLVSVFLMVPVASAFTSLYLDEVADAVEARHYPHLPPARRQGFWSGLGDSLTFLGALIGANLAALILYLLMPPAAPLIFLGLNGWLLGREYVQLAALRRMSPDQARSLRRAHSGEIWAAGILMALPLTIPLVNLLVPVLGAATFTHLVTRVSPKSPADQGRAH